MARTLALPPRRGAAARGVSLVTGSPSPRGTSVAGTGPASSPKEHHEAQLRQRRREPGAVHRIGGTAVAAATLAPDSVGSPQIRADAVRSAEIRTDAVRSPEIAKDAVRGSEIRDASVLLADIAPDARTALGTNVRVAKKDFVEVPVCVGEDLKTCPDVLKRTLSPGAWLVEARLGVSSPDGSGSFANRCGLVTEAATGGPLVFDDPRASQPPQTNVQTEVIDDLRIGALGKDNQVEAIALSGVLDGALGEPTVAVRCNVQQFDELDAEDVKITAQKVGSIVGE